LGMPIEQVSRTLSREPLASASVAQVHRATLLNGDDVVVKVVRPGIEQTVRADIKLLKQLAAVVARTSSLGKRLRPEEVVHDYEKVILDELNLLAEAANTIQLRRNFADSSMLDVPKVYWDFCRKNVLVMERIHGIPVTQLEQLKAHGIDMKKLAERGVDIFFTQVFEHNFFHADM
ncbi:MAG TPA: ubiquinone biosynthesis regulatory protein kinase UbiB, partial [Gammaproteobacteria bacterium]|nr:ubiquinone biosynthesis regulatory protein kinase UbiB [Gammaproteobacteria bacterium]